jgi:hypothetical protein
VSQVRQDANSQSATVSVLVANKLIPQSSSGDVIASQKWYSVVSTPKDQVKDGAITTPHRSAARSPPTTSIPTSR